MPRFRLKFHSTEIDLPPGEVIIGRALECFIRLDDAMVSRRHAKLEVGRNEVVLCDLGSRNGVSVNGQKVKGSFQLKVGDRIALVGDIFPGNYEFTIRGIFDSPRAADMMYISREYLQQSLPERRRGSEFY